MATAHLIHGYLGAGKSTYARRLAAETGAVLLCFDEWYLRLYTDGSPTGALDDDLLNRLYAVLNDHWPRLLAAGVDVVLDFGFWSRSWRDDARALAAAAGAEPRLHWVQTSDETALARCLTRNEDPGSAFLLDRDAYVALKARYDPPSADETVQVVKT